MRHHHQRDARQRPPRLVGQAPEQPERNGAQDQQDKSLLEPGKRGTPGLPNALLGIAYLLMSHAVNYRMPQPGFPESP